MERALTTPQNSHIAKITYDGKTFTIREWAKVLNIKYEALVARIKRGWPVKEALTQAVQVRR